MHKCPCCSETLLRHIKHGSIYWFCTHCWQEMPDLQPGVSNKLEANRSHLLSQRLVKLASPLAV